MRALKKAYCRTFQFALNYAALCLPWRKPERTEGAGSIAEIPGLLARAGAKHPLVVTGPTLMAAGVGPAVLRVLEEGGIPTALYAGVAPNPTVELVEEIRALYLSEGCDSFVALGGGSNLDAAKAAAARIARPGRSVNRMGGLLKVLRRLPPLIAVPTTAGSGSETTIAAIVTDGTTRHKYAIMDLCLVPRFAVLDPVLTLGLPPAVTAATGMDALTHAVEAYLCWTCNTAESLRFAEEAVAAIFKNLERVYQDGSDLDGRMALLTASFQAGFAFTRSGVGNVHAIAHTLGGLYNTAHGLANAVLLPIVLEDYGDRVHSKLARLAALAGVAACGSEAERAAAFIQAVRDLNARMGLPNRFDFIRRADIPQMADWAYREANPLYPVPVLYSRERFCAVIEKVRS